MSTKDKILRLSLHHLEGKLISVRASEIET
jgi:hypothetical protein